MRHQLAGKRFGANSQHKLAILRSMTISLISHKKIVTTLTKGKELRRFAEPIINKSKQDTTHTRRYVFDRLRNKGATTELFTKISPKIQSRPGGYLRLLKCGFRSGDSAPLVYIELIDAVERQV